MESVGFTGTRKGMTYFQKSKVEEVLQLLKNKGFWVAHHGVCIGSDADFHDLATKVGFWMVGHPGVDSKGGVVYRATLKCGSLCPEKYFPIRDKDIVEASERMIATPSGKAEIYRWSGTWLTIRIARKAKVPTIIIFPDGTFQLENVQSLAEFYS